MENQRLDELLEDRSDASASLRSPGFAAAVLAQAKLVKAAILRHRRLLMISSLIAVALAVLISAQVGRSVETIPPPLDGFREPSFSTP